MRASATILAQRYLEGDMTEHERAAFIEDLTHDSHLQEILEQEMQLDVSIINDAFSIEPPTAMRQAVLDAISSHPHRYVRGFAGHSIASLMAMMLCAIGSTVGTSDALLSNAFATVPHVSNEQAYDTPTSRTTAQHVSTAQMMRQELNEEFITNVEGSCAPDEHEITTIDIASPSAPRAARIAAYYSVMQQMEPPSAISAPLVSATLGSSVGSFRYNIATPVQLKVFAEGGFIGMNRTSVSYVNQYRTAALQQATLGYAALGIAGTIADLPFGERSLMGSFAIGATAAGPMVMADLSTSLFEIGPTTIDAGIRMVGISDLRNAGAVSLQTLPFVRLSLGF